MSRCLVRPRSARRLRVSAGLLAGLVAAAIPAASAPPSPVTVAVAASLREPVEALAQAFATAPDGGRVEASFGATPVLARQIEAGAPIDVLLAADEGTVDALIGRGLILRDSRTAFAGNRLAVLVRPELAGSVDSPDDLARSTVSRVALPDAAVPLGHYAREWLIRLGLESAVLARALRTEDARATLAAVDAGHADVAIVYASDARLAKRAQPAFAIPDADQPRIVYVGGVVARARDVARARAFLRFVAAAGARFEAAGFTPPPAP